MAKVEGRESKGAALDAAAAAMDKLGEVAPVLKNISEQAKPILDKIEPFVRAAYPYVVVIKENAVKGYYLVQPYWDEEVGAIALALVLLLFGGHFAMTIACWQVFQLSGKRLVSKSWNELRESFQDALTNLKKDPEAKALFDHDKDGTIGLTEIVVAVKALAVATNEQEKKVARQKVALLMKCVDPTKIWDATIGIWTGLIAILATLRSRFVQSITIGASVGKKAVEILMPMMQPKLHEAFPQHIKWVDFMLRSAGGFVGAITALILIKFISACNSALEGANLLVKTLVAIKERKKIAPNFQPSLEQSRAAIYGLALVGVFVQFRAGFSLPLLLRIPLLPATMVEYILTLLATQRIF